MPFKIKIQAAKSVALYYGNSEDADEPKQLYSNSPTTLGLSQQTKITDIKSY